MPLQKGEAWEAASAPCSTLGPGSGAVVSLQRITVSISHSTGTQGKTFFLPERLFLVSKSNLETAGSSPSKVSFNGNSTSFSYHAFAPTNGKKKI